MLLWIVVISYSLARGLFLITSDNKRRDKRLQELKKYVLSNICFPLEIIEYGFTKAIEISGKRIDHPKSCTSDKNIITSHYNYRNIISVILHLDSIPQTDEKLSKVLKTKYIMYRQT